MNVKYFSIFILLIFVLSLNSISAADSAVVIDESDSSEVTADNVLSARVSDDDSQPLDSLETINYSDVSCIYCIENGETKNVPADIFFRIYSDYLGSGIRNVNRE